MTTFHQLKGFCRHVFIYFLVLGLETLEYISVPKYIFVVFKCFPILSLILFVYRKFHSLREMKKNKYGFHVFIGLCISLSADAVLVYGDELNFFVAGLGLFLVAIMTYLIGFGFEKFRPLLFLSSTIGGIVTYYVVFEMLSDAPRTVKLCCLAYIITGFTTLWRVWARVTWDDVVKGKWANLYAAVGAITFATSDITLVLNKFAFPIPAAGFIVMTTYYLAQLGIAVSVASGTRK